MDGGDGMGGPPVDGGVLPVAVDDVVFPEVVLDDGGIPDACTALMPSAIPGGVLREGALCSPAPRRKRASRERSCSKEPHDKQIEASRGMASDNAPPPPS